MSYISEIRKKIGHDVVIMPCACAIIADDNGRVLLQKRADDGRWGYHGGAIEVDETVEDALKRELFEEIGITPVDCTLFGVYSGPGLHHIYPNGDVCSCIDIVYLCKSYEGEIRFCDGEVTEVKWFSEKELLDNLSDSCRAPLRDYFRALRNNH